MREEVPDYERLQDETAAATGRGARQGARARHGHRRDGATRARAPPGCRARRPRREQRHARRMRARRCRPIASSCASRSSQDPLPEGPFDVVVSALAVHHLDGAEKADLFQRVTASLAPGGRFVLGDVVVPEDPVRPCDPDRRRSGQAEQRRGPTALARRGRAPGAGRLGTPRPRGAGRLQRLEPQLAAQLGDLLAQLRQLAPRAGRGGRRRGAAARGAAAATSGSGACSTAGASSASAESWCR